MTQIIITALDKQFISLFVGKLLDSDMLREDAVDEIVKWISRAVFHHHHRIVWNLKLEEELGPKIIGPTTSKLIESETFDILRSIFSILKPNPRKFHS